MCARACVAATHKRVLCGSFTAAHETRRAISVFQSHLPIVAQGVESCRCAQPRLCQQRLYPAGCPTRRHSVQPEGRELQQEPDSAVGGLRGQATLSACLNLLPEQRAEPERRCTTADRTELPACIAAKARLLSSVAPSSFASALSKLISQSAASRSVRLQPDRQTKPERYSALAPTASPACSFALAADLHFSASLCHTPGGTPISTSY